MRSAGLDSIEAGEVIDEVVDGEEIAALATEDFEDEWEDDDADEENDGAVARLRLLEGEPDSIEHALPSDDRAGASRVEHVDVSAEAAGDWGGGWDAVPDEVEVFGWEDEPVAEVLAPPAPAKAPLAASSPREVRVSPAAIAPAAPVAAAVSVGLIAAVGAAALLLALGGIAWTLWPQPEPAPTPAPVVAEPIAAPPPPAPAPVVAPEPEPDPALEAEPEPEPAAAPLRRRAARAPVAAEPAPAVALPPPPPPPPPPLNPVEADDDADKRGLFHRKKKKP